MLIGGHDGLQHRSDYDSDETTNLVPDVPIAGIDRQIHADIQSDPILGPLVAFIEVQIEQNCRNQLRHRLPDSLIKARLERMEGSLFQILESLSTIQEGVKRLCIMQSRLLMLMQAVFTFLFLCISVALSFWLASLSKRSL